jgi:hypothetical protein
MKTVLDENCRQSEEIERLKSCNFRMSCDTNSKDELINYLQNSVAFLTDVKKDLSHELELTKAKLLHSEQTCCEYKMAKLQSDSKISQFEKQLAKQCCDNKNMNRLNIQKTLDEYFQNGSEIPNHVLNYFKSEPEVSANSAHSSKLPQRVKNAKRNLNVNYRINTKSKSDGIKSCFRKEAIELLNEQHKLGNITKEDIETAKPKIINILYFQRGNGKLTKIAQIVFSLFSKICF